MKRTSESATLAKSKLAQMTKCLSLIGDIAMRPPTPRIPVTLSMLSRN